MISQNLNIPLNQTFSIELNRAITASDQIIHSSFKPLLARDSKNADKVDALRIVKSERSWVAKRLFREHFIKLDSANFKLTIDPIVNFELGVDDQLDNRDDPK